MSHHPRLCQSTLVPGASGTSALVCPLRRATSARDRENTQCQRISIWSWNSTDWVKVQQKRYSGGKGRSGGRGALLKALSHCFKIIFCDVSSCFTRKRKSQSNAFGKCDFLLFFLNVDWGTGTLASLGFTVRTHDQRNPFLRQPF